MKLKELLEQYPEAKEEYELQLETLSGLGTCIIEEQGKYIDVLEGMIEEGEDREEILKVIDDRNQWTVRLRMDGVLGNDIEWWETVL